MKSKTQQENDLLARCVADILRRRSVSPSTVKTKRLQPVGGEVEAWVEHGPKGRKSVYKVRVPVSPGPVDWKKIEEGARRAGDALAKAIIAGQRAGEGNER